MRIVVDVMGGDHGPQVIIEGARLALQSNDKITQLFLVGRQDEIKSAMDAAALRDPRVKVVPASQVLSMEDKPVEAVRRKKDSSVLRAVELLKEGQADALICPGNTGGLLAAATIGLRNLAGVDRACIATVIPCADNEFVLLDVGASIECRPSYLLQFAIMGRIYSREILGCKNPRVGILSYGTEPNKGTETTLEAYRLCQLAGPKINLNFIGNVEGHDLFNNRVDVVVCDGFVGNIVLKTLESFAKGLVALVKNEIYKNPKRILGGMLAKSAFRAIEKRMDSDARGGAPLLGLNGTIIKAHGSARERAVMNAIGLSTQAVQHRINQLIESEIALANDALAPVHEHA